MTTLTFRIRHSQPSELETGVIYDRQPFAADLMHPDSKQVYVTGYVKRMNGPNTIKFHIKNFWKPFDVKVEFIDDYNTYDY
jgi:hypothetical protein